MFQTASYHMVKLKWELVNPVGGGNASNDAQFDSFKTQTDEEMVT